MKEIDKTLSVYSAILELRRLLRNGLSLIDVIERPDRPLEFFVLLDCVREVFQVDADKIIGKDNHQGPSEARHIMAMILHDRRGHTMDAIGEWLNGRSRTTIYSSVKKGKDLIGTSRSSQRKYNETINMFNHRMEVLEL